LAVTQF